MHFEGNKKVYPSLVARRRSRLVERKMHFEFRFNQEIIQREGFPPKYSLRLRNENLDLNAGSCGFKSFIFILL